MMVQDSPYQTHDGPSATIFRSPAKLPSHLFQKSPSPVQGEQGHIQVEQTSLSQCLAAINTLITITETLEERKSRMEDDIALIKDRLPAPTEVTTSNAAPPPPPPPPPTNPLSLPASPTANKPPSPNPPSPPASTSPSPTPSSKRQRTSSPQHSTGSPSPSTTNVNKGENS